MTELVGSNLSVVVHQVSLLKAASLSLNKGELVVLLGPNGAGKSMLLRAALGLVKLNTGGSTLGGDDVRALSPMQRAQRIAYLPQTRSLAWPNVVRDLVALGRFSHGAVLGRLKGLDAEAVDKAIEACDIVHLANRKADTLSGGELARVHCARAFAAEAALLIADEPIAALDPRHQFRVMDLISDYVAVGGGALVVLHDVSLAARYASRLIWMKGGEIVADGRPSDTLSAERLRDIYGVRAHVNGLRVEIEGAD